MREEDLIRSIEEQTRDLPVPDSLSPRQMKRMLDAYRDGRDPSRPAQAGNGADAQTEHGASGQAQNGGTLSEGSREEGGRTSPAGNREENGRMSSAGGSAGPGREGQREQSGKRRSRRGLIAAACLILCFAGSLGAARLIKAPSNDNRPAGKVPAAADSEDGKDNLAAASESSATDNDGEGQEDENALVYPTTMKSPSSYEEYYKTLKSAYDEYYDRISSVYTIGLEKAEVEEAADDAMFDSVDSDDVAVNMAEAPVMAESVKQSARGMAADEAKSAGKEKFSATNTQEKSVDEGDIIKTDGKWIYRIIQAYNNRTGRNTWRLTITKAEKGSLTPETTLNLEKVPKTADNDRINFYRMECYLYGDRLILVYDCETDREEQTEAQTWFVAYDLKDRAHPEEKYKLCQSGWYETSRISDGYLYIISNFDGNRLDDEKEYRNYIPYVNGKPVECEDIYYPRKLLLEQTHVLTSIDLKHPDTYADTKAIPSTGSQYYVSEEAIYLYATDYGNVVRTTILRVAYDKGTITVGSSAAIAGRLYDTFALNEYGGYLRIVATIPASGFPSFRIWDDTMDLKENASVRDAEDEIDVPGTVREDVNALYILDRNMKLTGKITGLAPGETIYSARFFGDTGYFVTYKNMDPLFSVDLSDPENPKVMGALKIAGFSNYLHFYDRNLLLGIGQETDPDTQEFLGLKVSMFDISDPSDVREEDKYIIQHSDYSDALYHHKAILVDPEKNIFGFCYMGSFGRNGTYMMKYVTFTYDKEKGFVETAAYPVGDEEVYDCSRIRGLYIGEYFYLVTDTGISSYRIGSQEEVDRVSF